MEFSVQELWAHTSAPVKYGVFPTLIVMLIACLYVAIERLIALGKARGQSRMLAAEIVAPLSKKDAAEALRLARQDRFKSAYLGRLVVVGLNEFTARKDHYGIEVGD